MDKIPFKDDTMPDFTLPYVRHKATRSMKIMHIDSLVTYRTPHLQNTWSDIYDLSEWTVYVKYHKL